jgi:hypothetical protein
MSWAWRPWDQAKVAVSAAVPCGLATTGCLVDPRPDVPVAPAGPLPGWRSDKVHMLARPRCLWNALTRTLTPVLESLQLNLALLNDQWLER